MTEDKIICILDSATEEKKLHTIINNVTEIFENGGNKFNLEEYGTIPISKDNYVYYFTGSTKQTPSWVTYEKFNNFLKMNKNVINCQAVNSNSELSKNGKNANEAFSPETIRRIYRITCVIEEDKIYKIIDDIVRVFSGELISHVKGKRKYFSEENESPRFYELITTIRMPEKTRRTTLEFFLRSKKEIIDFAVSSLNLSDRAATENVVGKIGDSTYTTETASNISHVATAYKRDRRTTTPKVNGPEEDNFVVNLFVRKEVLKGLSPAQKKRVKINSYLFSVIILMFLFTAIYSIVTGQSARFSEFVWSLVCFGLVVAGVLFLLKKIYS